MCSVIWWSDGWCVQGSEGGGVGDAASASSSEGEPPDNNTVQVIMRNTDSSYSVSSLPALPCLPMHAPILLCLGTLVCYFLVTLVYSNKAVDTL